MGDLSQHFSRHEFDCRDGTPVPAAYAGNLHGLVYGVLEPIRNALGLPVTVLSGYRTPEHNAAEGGAPDSMHLYAKAADIWVPAFDTGDTKLWAFVRHLWSLGLLPDLGGLGRYINRIHVDDRPHAPGVLVEWDNRSTGERG